VPYLYIDATFLNARWARQIENVSALVAYGVGLDGHRKLLAITIGAEESEASWADLLDQLLARGLHGTQLVIADEHAGLINAVRKKLPEAKRQRCTVHFTRNVAAKVPKRLRKRVAVETSAIFKSDGLEAAKEAQATFVKRWAKELPEAVECLENGFKDAATFFAFPKEHWMRLRSTNGLERLHGEIKRRTKSISAFPDRASALRLITAVAMRATSTWADRRYLNMSLLRASKEAA